MFRCLGIVGVLALIAQGCTKKPESIALANFFHVDYQTWTCQQLAEEADLLSDALAVDSQQQRNARTDNAMAHLKRASEAVHKAQTVKRCSV